MFIVATDLYVQVAFGSIGKGFKKMVEHFCWHIADLFPFKIRIPNQPGPSAKVNCYLCQCIIHWESETIAPDTFFIAQRFANGFAERNCSVFDSMMFVNLQITFCLYGKINAAVTAQLVKHMIKEMQARADLSCTRAIQVQFNPDICFVRISLMYE